MTQVSQRELAEKAQKLVNSRQGDQNYLERQDDTPNEGLNNVQRDEHAARGSLDAEGQRPVLERSRKVR